MDQKRNNKRIWKISSFFKIYFYREEGKEKERERNINVWFPLELPLLWTWNRHVP